MTEAEWQELFEGHTQLHQATAETLRAVTERLHRLEADQTTMNESLAMLSPALKMLQDQISGHEKQLGELFKVVADMTKLLETIKRRMA